MEINKVPNRVTKLIGISGCTNGGKTTLSRKLLSKLANSYHLSQDDFYHNRESNNFQFIPECNSFNFDVISAIDMKKFHKKLDKLVKSGKYDYIFLDGILLYEDEKLFKMLDKKYFLYLDKDECHKRRQNRNYILADTGNYFDLCVWTEFMKYKQKCELTYKSITYLNGADPADCIFEIVLNDLNSLSLA